MTGVERILALSPHPDDAELGAGASLARYAAQGARVTVVVFSMPELRSEYDEAHSRLGINETIRLDYPRRNFSGSRQQILDAILDIMVATAPQLVLLPSSQDMHQDHTVIHAEGLRACKHASILGYELPWNHLTFTAGAFIAIDESALESKTAALRAYNSQRDRPYFQPGYMESVARMRGGQVGTTYAEAYEVVRMTW